MAQDSFASTCPCYNKGVVVREEKELEVGNDFALLPEVVNQCLLNIRAEEKKIYEIKIGLFELLVNAIEYGNLEITSEEKEKIYKKEDYYQYTLKKGKKYKDRKIRVRSYLDKSVFSVEIEDKGPGFAPKKIPPEDFECERGRGIFLACSVFDEVNYLGKGNRVKATKRLNS